MGRGWTAGGGECVAAQYSTGDPLSWELVRGRYEFTHLLIKACIAFVSPYLYCNGSRRDPSFNVKERHLSILDQGYWGEFDPQIRYLSRYFK